MGPESEAQTEALWAVAQELEELNSHVRAYLTTMALTLMGECGGSPEAVEAQKRARDAAAVKLLKHVQATTPEEQG